MTDANKVKDRNFIVVHLKTAKELNFTLDDKTTREFEEALDNSRVYPRGEMAGEFNRFFDVVCERTNRKYYLDFSQIAGVVIGDFIDYSGRSSSEGIPTNKPIRRSFVVEKK